MLTTSIRPRFSETDALGHINNTVIPVWFLQAREPVLQHFRVGTSAREIALAVVRMEVDYLAETEFGEDVEIRTAVARIGNSSFVLAQEVFQNHQCTARGMTTLVHFNPQSRRAEPVPDSVRDKLESLMPESTSRE